MPKVDETKLPDEGAEKPVENTTTETTETADVKTEETTLEKKVEEKPVVKKSVVAAAKTTVVEQPVEVKKVKVKFLKEHSVYIDGNMQKFSKGGTGSFEKHVANTLVQRQIAHLI